MRSRERWEFQNEKISLVGESVRQMSEAIRMLTSRNPINVSTSGTTLDRDDNHGAAEDELNRTYQHGYRRNNKDQGMVSESGTVLFD